LVEEVLLGKELEHDEVEIRDAVGFGILKVAPVTE